ncbi:MAG TPA: stage V sporulation protein S [Anaerolineales bacterium]
MKGDGINVVCTPHFVDVAVDDKVLTAIRLVIEPN